MTSTILEAVLNEDETLDHYGVKANKLTKEQEYRKNRSRTTAKRTAAASATFSALSSMVMSGSVGTHTLASAVAGAGMDAVAGAGMGAVASR